MAESLASIPPDARCSRSASRSEAFAELFGGDVAPEHCLTKLLAIQCRHARAEAAVIVRPGKAGRCEVLAAYPLHKAGNDFLNWIDAYEKSFHKTMESGKTVIICEDPEPVAKGKPSRYLIVLPILNPNGVRAAAAFRIRAPNRQKLLVSHARLETTSLLLNHYELNLVTKKHHETTNRLRRVLEVLDVVNSSERFLGATMALCNEIAAGLGCKRVSMGFLKGHGVHLRAMSHTDTFSREMRSVQAIEMAMEECLDQDTEINHPAVDKVMYASRATAILSEEHGPSAVLSLPIRENGTVTAVLTLERTNEQPFDRLEEIETLRLICDLAAPRILGLSRSDRWLGARLASEARQHLRRIMGPEHTFAKLASALIFFVVVFLATVKGDYRIKAPFTLEARHQQVVVAPFDTFSKSVLVEPGDEVEGGKSILGTLETSELRLSLAALKAEQLGYQKEMTASMRDRKTAEAQIARAQYDKVAAEIRLIEKRIEQGALVAPISGWVVSEDLKQEIGAPVEIGKILFEIASIDSLRAELYVPEASIGYIAEGQTGELAAVGHPDQKVRFVIERINPIAEVVNHQNVFSARARILEPREWMRPGMEGQSRISAGKKAYLWIASHRLVNWLRMKLWV